MEDKKDFACKEVIPAKKQKIEHDVGNPIDESMNGNEIFENNELSVEKRKKNKNKTSNEALQNGMKNDTSATFEVNEQLPEENNKSKKKSLNTNEHWVEEQLNGNENKDVEKSISKKKRKKNKNKVPNSEVLPGDINSNNSTDIPTETKKKLQPKDKNQQKKKNTFVRGKVEKTKNKNIKKQEGLVSSLSDERLKAYGLNPKKYRSFMKFKKF